jgi:hypothetical protein
MSNGFQSSNGHYHFLPYCDDSGKATFGVYLFKDNLKLSSTSAQNAPVVNVYDSTFVFDYSSGAKIDVTGGSLNMWGPGLYTGSDGSNITSPFCGGVCGADGSFGSIAIWQWLGNPPVPCNNPISSQLGGNATGAIQGIVDLPCTDITVTGNSTNEYWISGALVAWDITIAGSGNGVVTQNRVAARDLPSGAVLVQ